MKKTIAIVIISTLLMPLFAQGDIFQVGDVLKVDESITGNLSIAFVPQYAISQGMRVDFDFKIANHQYLTFGPQWYYAKDSQRFYQDNVDMKGAGINVNYRYFFSDNRLPSGPYFGFGLHYKYMDLRYETVYWNNYMENGNLFAHQEYGPQELSIHQGGYDLLMGYQFAFNRFLMDFYLGWAFRLSDYDSDTFGNDWNETIFEPGYEGFLPTAGFRFGFLLK